MATLETIVICPDAGCLRCEHGEAHKYQDVGSSCVEGGDYNCPPCEEIEKQSGNTAKREVRKDGGWSVPLVGGDIR